MGPVLHVLTAPVMTDLDAHNDIAVPVNKKYGILVGAHGEQLDLTSCTSTLLFCSRRGIGDLVAEDLIRTGTNRIGYTLWHCFVAYNLRTILLVFIIILFILRYTVIYLAYRGYTRNCTLDFAVLIKSGR